MSNTHSLVLACVALALLTIVVSLRLLMERVGEMRARRLPTQAVATSLQMAQALSNTRAADNFRNLFEVPVLFYALCAMLLATQQVSSGYVTGAWLFVMLRVLHSLIQCTYNRVTHRLVVFLAGLSVVTTMWVALGLQVLFAQAR